MDKIHCKDCLFETYLIYLDISSHQSDDILFLYFMYLMHLLN